MPREHLPLFHPLALAVLGGFSEAVSFSFFGGFAGHITGGTVLAAIHLANHRTYLFWSQFSAIAIFIFATGLGTLFSPSRLRIALGIEALFFLSAYLLLRAESAKLSPDLLRTIVLALTSTGLGIQNGSLQKIRNVTVRTTFLTGTSTRWITQLIRHEPEESEKRALLGALMIFFFLGALIGALCAIQIHEQSYVIMAILAGVIGMTASGMLKQET